MEVYLWCNCGGNKVLLSKLKKYALENNIDLLTYETRYSPEKRAEHMALLSGNNLPTDSYLPVVYYDGVTKLKDFVDAL